MSIKNDKIMDMLYHIVQKRLNTPSKGSYISFLLESGPDTIHKKLIEEATETVEASEQADRDAIVHEVADLFFHTIVLIGKWQISPSEVYAELGQRWGKPGLKEKQERTFNGK